MITSIALQIGARRIAVGVPVSFGTRDWILGVAAVQAWSEGGRVRAQLRAHRTGDEDAVIVELADRDVVAMALVGPDDDATALLAAARAAPATPPSRAGIALAIAGVPAGEVTVDATTPDTARAFGHVFARWTRRGAVDAGIDLTPFVLPERGVKHTRTVSRALAAGAHASYAVTIP